MAAWVVCALCALVLLKPQEVVTPLKAVPLLYILFALALVLVVVDVVRKKSPASRCACRTSPR